MEYTNEERSRDLAAKSYVDIIVCEEGTGDSIMRGNLDLQLLCCSYALIVLSLECTKSTHQIKYTLNGSK